MLPIYFGLAIVAEEERLARQPALAAELDRLESAEGRGDLLEVAEQVRLRAMIFQHNVFFQQSEKADRAIARYLDVVKATLLNEHYLDHEVRFEQLSAHINRGRASVPTEVRDPVRNDQIAYRRARAQPPRARWPRRGGGDIVPPLHGHGSGPARPPGALPRHAAHREGAR